jgi:hypothetical protein
VKQELPEKRATVVRNSRFAIVSRKNGVQVGHNFHDPSETGSVLLICLGLPQFLGECKGRLSQANHSDYTPSTDRMAFIQPVDEVQIRPSRHVSRLEAGQPNLPLSQLFDAQS